jgi:hypothetical protein
MKWNSDQICIKNTDVFYTKALYIKYIEIGIFGMELYQLATVTKSRIYVSWVLQKGFWQIFVYVHDFLPNASSSKNYSKIQNVSDTNYWISLS